ncbi:MAG TPA: M1 family aminopeptidase [Marmoricola sp.]|nr:M1 family aminopeptidase [Marmoricola sp.]
MPIPHPFRTVVAGLVLASALTSCTEPDEPRAAPATPTPTTTAPGPAAATVTEPEPLDPTVSMTDAGAALYARSEAQEKPRPRYDVVARVEPTDGRVQGELTAVLPVGDEEAATFRLFAGLPELDAKPQVDGVEVDGEPAEVSRDASILEVALPEGHDEVLTVRMSFGYSLPEVEPAGGVLGGEMTPAEIGLLARHPDAMTLGHWMPLWIPEGRSADPVPDGFGDIGAFAAADVSVRLDVPDGWTVVDSGVRTGEKSTGDGRTVVSSEGAGMRDFAVALLRAPETRFRELDGALEGVTLSATGPSDSRQELDGVLDEAEAALRVLSDAYGGYPWREFDVVATPLGGSVAGMEWPGATFIEANLFAGGIPGLGDLGSSLDELGLDEESLADLVEELGGDGDEDLGLLLASTRAWTIAHEVAHSWWTVMVGNDSVEDPVVDEPLAQYTSCLVVRDSLPRGDEVCRSQLGSGYEQMRMLGGSDGPADRASDDFASSLQYGGLVYGKAAEFYLELEERYGVGRLTKALRALVQEGAFRMLTGDDVRVVLTEELGPEVDDLWTRWMDEAHGDADLL